ncbi:MAG: hypothetical protein FWF67_07410 [Fibromonadales bacterium]|nr:hypothetical protein [Fibromonadales bacterium]
MMKKVLAAALMCAVSSFATWDYFPVQAAGKGEAKLGFAYLMNAGAVEKLSIMGVGVDARYSIIDGLEAALFTTFPLSASQEIDGKSESCKAEGEFVCPPTYGPIVVGVRYWLPMGLGIALDVALPMQGDAYPFGGEKNSAKYNTHLDFMPAIQFSTNLTPELSLGSQVSLTIPGKTKDENDVEYTDGMDLGIGVEFDYAIGSITPYVGVDIALGMTKAKAEANGVKNEAEETAKAAIDVGLGATFDINENMAADVGVVLGFGGRYEHEEVTYDSMGIPTGTEKKSVMPVTIQAHFSYKF